MRLLRRSWSTFCADRSHHIDVSQRKTSEVLDLMSIWRDNSCMWWHLCGFGHIEKSNLGHIWHAVCTRWCSLIEHKANNYANNANNLTVTTNEHKVAISIHLPACTVFNVQNSEGLDIWTVLWWDLMMEHPRNTAFKDPSLVMVHVQLTWTILVPSITPQGAYFPTKVTDLSGIVTWNWNLQCQWRVTPTL